MQGVAFIVMIIMARILTPDDYGLVAMLTIFIVISQSLVDSGFSQALKDRDHCLVIVLRNEGGLLNARRIDAPSKLNTITSAETNYLAFDLYSNDYHIELFGALQNKIRSIDSNYNGSIKKTDEYIERQTPIYAPSIHQKTSRHPSGTPTYNTVCTLVRNHIDHPDTASSFTEEDLIVSTELLRSLLP